MKHSLIMGDSVNTFAICQCNRWKFCSNQESNLSHFARATFVIWCSSFLAATSVLHADSEPRQIQTKETIDVLKFVQPSNHSVRGDWSRRGNDLVCEKSEHALMLLPITVQGNYELNCEFTRRTGVGSINFICPIGESSGLISINGWEGLASGMGMIDGKIGPKLEVSSGAVVKPGKIKSGTKYHLRLVVGHTARSSTVNAWLNGKQFVKWRGEDHRIGTLAETILPCWEAIGVCVTKQSVADFHSIDLKLLSGEAFQLTQTFQNPLSKPLSTPPKEILNKCGQFNGRHYFISSEPVTLAEAKSMAKHLGGRMLTISSSEEEEFILQAGRGIQIWMAGWRLPKTNNWRDEQNQPLNYVGKWAPNQLRQKGFFENHLGIHTTTKRDRGWHNHNNTDKLHVCIEWGSESEE